jgi:hypothetical protein
MTTRQGRMPDSLYESLRAAAKELVWQAVRYEPGDRRPILLFSTRRGGSTWLMETIAANRGVLPLNQPLEILTPNLTPYQYRRMPKFDRGQIVHPDPDQEADLREYTDDLMAGRIRVNAPHRFWKKGFRFRTDRLLLKIVDAKPMMDWFDATYDVDIVYLVRHPVPQSMSCVRNGWVTSTRGYTRNDWFVDEVLRDSKLRDFAEERDRNGAPLERFVVNWVVENLFPLRVLAHRPHWLALSYEECVVDQERVFATICDRLELDDVDGMRRASARASRSSSMSSEESLSAIRGGDRQAQVAGWMDRITKDESAAVSAVLDRFGVSLYDVTSPMPDWSGYGR